MLNVSEIITIYENAIKSTLSSSRLPYEAFNKQVIRMVELELSKSKIDALVSESEIYETGVTVKVTTVDDILAYDLNLPFLSQLTVYADNAIVAQVAYSYVDNKSIYKFNDAKDLYIKIDKTLTKYVCALTKQTNVIAIDSIRNTDVVDYVVTTQKDKAQKLICYYSYGVMLFKLILGEIVSAYAHKPDNIEVNEILSLIKSTDVDIKCVNAVYSYSYKKGA